VSNNGAAYVPLDVQAIGALQNAGNASVLPSNTLTPDLSKGQTFLTTLDHALVIANPINTSTVTVGSLVRFYFVQGSAGFNSISSWGNKYQQVARFAARMGPGQVARADFNMNVDGSLTLGSFDGIDKYGPISVEDYGVVPNSTDAASANTAILKNIMDNVVTTNNSTIVLPIGNTSVSSPVLIHTPNTRLTGHGQNTSQLSPHGYLGPTVMGRLNNGGSGAPGGGGGNDAWNFTTPLLDTVVNYCFQSQALGTSPWISAGSVVSAPAATNNTSDVTDPNAGNTATKLVFPNVTGANAYSLVYQQMNLATVISGIYVFSVYLRTTSAPAQVYIDVFGTYNYSHTLCNVTSTWQRFDLVIPGTTATPYFAIGVDLRDQTRALQIPGLSTLGERNFNLAQCRAIM
jgi:hypothetical protein